MAEAAPTLSGWQIATYVLPAIPIAALGLPLTVHIPPLYAESTVLTLGLVGTLFSISKLVDVFTDPLFGWISDRFSPRWGRRRTWMIASAPVLMVSTYFLFHPPETAGRLYLVGWLSLVYLGYTMAFLSHLSWAAELARSYDERSRLMGWRQVGATAGMLLVLVLPSIGEVTGLIAGAAARAA
ncbi:MAG: MFS transporter, partial [Pseudomonadota bacterium]